MQGLTFGMRSRFGYGLLALGLLAWMGPQASAATRGWLGVSVREMTPSLRQEYDLGDRNGLLITEVIPNSPADDAGLEEDDVILKYDGHAVEIAEAFSRMVRETTPGTKVELVIWRDGEEKKITVTIEKMKRRRPTFIRSDGVHIIMGRAQLGVRVQELNADLARYFDVAPNSGVLILEVLEDSPAASAGLKAGDVIVKVDDEPVRDPEALTDLLEDYEDGDVVTVEYVRRGQTGRVEVELEDHGFYSFPRYMGDAQRWMQRWMPDFYWNWWDGGWNRHDRGRRRVIIRPRPGTLQSI